MWKFWRKSGDNSLGSKVSYGAVQDQSCFKVQLWKFIEGKSLLKVRAAWNKYQQTTDFEEYWRAAEEKLHSELSDTISGVLSLYGSYQEDPSNTEFHTQSSMKRLLEKHLLDPLRAEDGSIGFENQVLDRLDKIIDQSLEAHASLFNLSEIESTDSMQLSEETSKNFS